MQRQYFFSAQASIVLPREYRRKKNELSPFSIKEATDKLPMGICFADPNGRIILCNNRMRRLSFALCDQEPQIKSDMENALTLPDKSVTVKDDCYILPDKTVWEFRTQNITVDGDDRWQQITAHNVTELYNGYQKQEEINKELAEVNRELRKMYARMEDDVKEKESLDLKVYIHDTIGRSLLTIRDIIDSGEDTERKLEALQNAIGMLASNRVTSVSTMDEVKRTARQLGVTVKIDGYLPRDTAAEELTVAAAERIKKAFPQIKIVVATSLVDPEVLQRAKLGAADSLWYKDHGTEELMSVVKRTLAGEKVFPNIAPAIEMEGTMYDAFSPRQLDILRLYIKGFTYQEIADKLGISKNGVRWNLDDMVEKGGFESREALVATAIENKLMVTTLKDE